MKITQSTYDETVLENQEVFDLTPDEAVLETISQLKQQGICDLDKCIVVAHPESVNGKHERMLRNEFERLLHVLDSVVQTDGRPVICPRNDDANILGADDIRTALKGVRDFCAGRIPQSFEMIASLRSAERLANFESDDSIASVPVKSIEESDSHLPYLWLIHSSGSIYTLMSLLGVIPIDTLNDNLLLSDDSRNLVLKEVVLTLIAITSPRRSSEKDIKVLIRDSFSAFDRVRALISYFKSLNFSSIESVPEAVATANIKILTDLIVLASVVCRNSEKNKVFLVRAGKTQVPCNHDLIYKESSTIALLAQLLKSSYVHCISLMSSATQVKYPQIKEYFRQLTETCRLISILCRFDDFRIDAPGKIDSSYGMNTSSVHDHVLEFYREGTVPILSDIAKLCFDNLESCSDQFQLDRISLATSVLVAMKTLAVNDDIVQSLVAMGTLSFVTSALDIGLRSSCSECIRDETNLDSSDLSTVLPQVSSAALGLVRNLCGNDEIKTTFCVGHAGNGMQSIVPSMIRTMSCYRSNASIQEHGCGAFAAMALRKPINALRIVDEGGAREIVVALKQYPDNVLVQRQGALAIRNIVCRLHRKEAENVSEQVSKDMKSLQPTTEINVRDVFLELGAENVLRDITGRNQGSVDEAYAALRDLGCNVSIVKYDSDNNIMVNRTLMFGEIKPQFRPIYDESDPHGSDGNYNLVD